MAKGIRSHVKKRANVVKRATVFKPVEDLRLARLAALQVEAATKPSVGDHMEQDTKEQGDDMMTDEPKKISTSGPRKNSKTLRAANFKKKKGAKKNKKTTNKF
ncbi:uncharacterized protein BX664DRAFT_335560 [Halteromyces radiatus]|uniref:uncharacterized protein n=1 Tax=Halteromyces radiatus TaxID=101107 RepID=UPI00221F4DA2|nr:uncharacterized protein BX664DRAFT_335560 [Halteromyces radiatus]KAI8086341.1 hypothetical protein BX664DRAFT_335560 [Halteromyces radiatus]